MVGQSYSFLYRMMSLGMELGLKLGDTSVVQAKIDSTFTMGLASGKWSSSINFCLQRYMKWHLSEREERKKRRELTDSLQKHSRKTLVSEIH